MSTAAVHAGMKALAFLFAAILLMTPVLQAAAASAKTIHQIRDDIKAANDRDGSGHYEAIIPYLADKIETLHEPRFPNDGFIEGKRLAKSLPIEHKMHDAMLENRKFDVTFTVRGENEIVVKGNMTGILRHDGKPLVHPVNIVWTFDKGKLVRIWVDASNPHIKEGYQRQGEAMKSEAVRPLYEQMIKAMQEP